MKFAQTTEIVPGVNMRRVGHNQCFKCTMYSRYSNQCPDPPRNVVGDQHHINTFELAMWDYEAEVMEEEVKETAPDEIEAPITEEEGVDPVEE